MRNLPQKQRNTDAAVDVYNTTRLVSLTLGSKQSPFHAYCVTYYYVTENSMIRGFNYIELSNLALRKDYSRFLDHHRSLKCSSAHQPTIRLNSDRELNCIRIRGRRSVRIKLE